MNEAPPPPPPPPGYQIVPSGPSPDTAFILELLLGFFGFLGIGRLYAGRTGEGLLFLFGWWVFLVVEVLLMALVVGFCLIPLNFIVPIWSAISLRDSLRRG